MNIEKLQEFSPDLKLKKLNNITIIFFETLCNSEYINNFILKPIVKYNINNFYKLKNKLPYNFKGIDNEREIYFYIYILVLL